MHTSAVLIFIRGFVIFKSYFLARPCTKVTRCRCLCVKISKNAESIVLQFSGKFVAGMVLGNGVKWFDTSPLHLR